MIVKLQGGPRDGEEIEIPSEWIIQGRSLRIPDAISDYGIWMEPPVVFDQPLFRVMKYEPIQGEIGDLQFTGYET